jgi:hypothetical protein
VITQAAALDAHADEANHREKNKGKARGNEERIKAEEMDHEDKKKNAEAEIKQEVLEKQEKVRI